VSIRFTQNGFQFSRSAGEDNINHSLHAIHTMQTVANFFVAIEARKNNHAFASRTGQTQTTAAVSKLWIKRGEQCTNCQDPL
jgi:hypothetical protein